jgi:quinol monooxygenase YgiN
VAIAIRREADIYYARLGAYAEAMPTASNSCAIVELRQYTLHPGRRDELIDLFEHAFVEGQEDAGMTVTGVFRDMRDPDRFVWLREFANMPARAQALEAFYGGPIWKANRDAANATMIDSDNVLLLRPARRDSGFALDEPGGGLVAAMVFPIGASGAEAFVEFFERTLEPALVDAGSTVLATFVTEHAANTFPALPIRTGENVFVCFARFVDRAAFDRYGAALAGLAHGHQPSESMLLAPTPRSRVR